MALLDEAHAWDKERILVEIERRQLLMNQMVGQLYPSIVANEIDLLYRLLEKSQLKEFRADIKRIYGEDCKLHDYGYRNNGNLEHTINEKPHDFCI